MKLVLCTSCNDVYSLDYEKKTCSCGKSWGRYVDELKAKIGGTHSVPLGLHNDSFIEAIRNRPEVGLGREFKAWVIPKNCSTVIVE